VGVILVRKREEKQGRKFTRHQLAKWQQQKKRQRIFLILGIGVIAVVGGVIGAGWYRDEYQPMHEIVIKVNDTEFEMGQYIDTLKISADLYEQIYGGSESSIYMQSVADQAVIAIQQRELIRQGAMELGITVTDSEVSEELKKNDPPLGSEFRELVRGDMLRTKLLDEYFEEEVPVFAEQKRIKAMFLESENEAVEVKGKLEAGGDFAGLASEYSLENIAVPEDEEPAGDEESGWYPEDILLERLGYAVVADYVFSAGLGLSGPLCDEDRAKDVGYWLVKLVERDEDEQGELLNVQVMLLSSEEEALDIMERLELGEDFSDLAKESSQDTASKEDGGDLGWLDPEELADPLKEFILAAEPGAFSEPIKDEDVVTKGGYWLVDIIDTEENRRISDSDRDFLKRKDLDEWISALWDNPENLVESYFDDEQIAWAIDRATGH
jgi:parvulin-like peptidyl-prolyl isomerase